MHLSIGGRNNFRTCFRLAGNDEYKSRWHCWCYLEGSLLKISRLQPSSKLERTKKCCAKYEFHKDWLCSDEVIHWTKIDIVWVEYWHLRVFFFAFSMICCFGKLKSVLCILYYSPSVSLYEKRPTFGIFQLHDADESVQQHSRDCETLFDLQQMVQLFLPLKIPQKIQSRKFFTVSTLFERRWWRWRWRWWNGEAAVEHPHRPPFKDET